MIEQHQFVLCFCGHIVNYEMFTSLPLHTKDIGMCHLYMSFPQNKGLNWLLRLRARYGAIIIPSRNPIRTLRKLQSELNEKKKIKGYVFGSLSDMDSKKDDKHSAPFLDHRLEVKTGGEKIARRMNMAFCYAHVNRPKRGFYEVKFLPVVPKADTEDDEFAYTDEFVRMLDINIREQPEIWMQWGECRF